MFILISLLNKTLLRGNIINAFENTLKYLHY